MRVKRESLARRWLERLAWLGAIWVVGVAGMGLVTTLLRGLMRAVGLAS